MHLPMMRTPSIFACAKSSVPDMEIMMLLSWARCPSYGRGHSFGLRSLGSASV